MRVADALTFMAADREHAEEAWAGDIIGLHNHGTINIGDTFTEGESLMFTGIPNFAPEMFRRVVLRDPLRMKALQKGLEYCWPKYSTVSGECASSGSEKSTPEPLPINTVLRRSRSFAP